MTKPGVGLLICTMFLSACAHRPEVEAMRLPAPVEIQQYVASQWIQVYSERLGRFVGISTTGSQFLTVKDLNCGRYLADVAQCTFVVQASLTDGTVIEHGLYDQFSRAEDGSVRETLVLVEPRVPRCTSWRPLANLSDC